MLKFKTEYYRTIAKDTNAEKTVGELCDEIDRLRGEQQTPPQGKTVDVRFPGLIDGNGEVIINQYHRHPNGAHNYSIHDWPRATRFWLTATLLVPVETTVVASVNDDKCPTCGRIGDPACKTVGCAD